MREPHVLAHRLVKVLHQKLLATDMTRNELGRRAGLSSHTLAEWWSAKKAPGLYNIEAALNVFGMTIAVVDGTSKAAHSGILLGPSAARVVRKRNESGQYAS